MDLVVFENNKPWVIDEFREGHFDYVELASDVAETKFFGDRQELIYLPLGDSRFDSDVVLGQSL